MADAGATSDTGTDAGDVQGYEVDEGSDHLSSPLIPDGAPLVPGDDEGSTVDSPEFKTSGQKSKSKAKKEAPKEGRVLTKKTADEIEGKVDVSRETPDEGPSGTPGIEEIESYFLNELDPQPAKKDEEEIELPEGVDPDSRLGNRWKNLLEERKAWKQEQAQLAEGYQEAQRNAWQQHNARLAAETRANEQIAALRAELAGFKGELKALNQQPQQQLSEQEQIEQRWLSMLDQAMEKKAAERAKPLEEKLDRLGKFIVQQKDKADLYRIKQGFAKEADQAIQEVVLDGLDEKTSGSLDREMLKRIVYAFTNDFQSRGVNLSIADSARVMRKVALQMGLAYVRGAHARNKQQQQRNANAPAQVPKGKHMQGAKGDPPHWLVKANGWKDVPDWEMNGRPPLKRPKKSEE